MLPREITIDIENKTLSEYACRVSESKGRAVPEEPCEVRTDFQRDRDRIIHSNAFRRLKHKTQVFLIPKSDHYRTRLTHTLEVSQIARTIARALRLNEDLTEAIALGHDLGHTPFGHDGERTLAKLYSGGFTHYEQGVRVVEKIERDGKGLNLTKEVINGIYCHTNKTADTLEGVIVKFADKIAYINHDIEDAIRGGVIKATDLPEGPIKILGDTKSKRITTLTKSIIANSTDEIRYDDEVRKAHDDLRAYMFENVYYAEATNHEKTKACAIVEYLYDHYLKNIDELPKLYLDIATEEGKEKAICDYISCMTDEYAIDRFTDLCVPKSWNRNYI